MEVWQERRATVFRAPSASVFKNHPRLALIVVLSSLFLILLLTAEIALRFLVKYRIDYYTYVTTSNSTHHYPYGELHINSYGYPDVEWNLTDPRPRIGVVGDSVTLGVGAGAGYRYTDLLAQRFPSTAFFNFAGVGQDGISGTDVVNDVIALTERFGLKKIVYGMNLNDILPTTDEKNAVQKEAALSLIDHVRYYFDGLRGRSYLYNTLRTQVKFALVRMGYEVHGMEAFELMPAKNESAVRDTASRINSLARVLESRGVGFCVVIFPYEMQVSSEAASTYKRFGVTWEPAFEEGLAQHAVQSSLDPSIRSVDVLEGFLKNGGRSARVGQYFVYNLGDKLDWNHPNRAGHRLIADYLATQASDCVSP
jgi:lysophospholipase L1-like esterase